MLRRTIVTLLVVASAAVTMVPANAAGTQVKLGKTSHGRVLVGPSGLSLYLFTPDTRNKSKCNVVCQYAWPPLKTSGRPRAATGVRQGELGQTAQHQVTYYGHPLYYYGGDSKPGQASGEGIHSFGGSWYLVNANGRAVK